MTAAANVPRSPFQELRLLEERVRLAGASLPKNTEFREQWQGIKLRIAGAQCVVPLGDVTEILKNKVVTPIPGCAVWVKGVQNLRGRLLPVFAVEEFFAGSKRARSRVDASEVLVVEKGALFCGIIAEQIHGMEKFFEDAFRPLGEAEKAALGPLSHFVRLATEVEEKKYYRLDIEGLSKALAGSNPSVR